MLALGAGGAAGCADPGQATSSAATAGPSSDTGSSGSSGGLRENPAKDASVSATPPYRGNPLCHADATSCMPDDDGYRRSPMNIECATAAPDASQAGFESKGCRIARDVDSGAIGPRCFVTAAPSGGDGATCKIGEDCAPGFDCVVGDKGTKVCRHYCCGGTCKGNLANGSATFCDVQSIVDVNQQAPVDVKAPVCMPLKRCAKLLGTTECGSTESCTLVTEDGDTGCVLNGDQQVGESCDESRCAAKLTCLGQPGARKCFKLCKVNGTDCPSSQSCLTSAAFHDADFGICQ